MIPNYDAVADNNSVTYNHAVADNDSVTQQDAVCVDSLVPRNQIDTFDIVVIQYQTLSPRESLAVNSGLCDGGNTRSQQGCAQRGTRRKIGANRSCQTHCAFDVYFTSPLLKHVGVRNLLSRIHQDGFHQIGCQ